MIWEEQAYSRKDENGNVISLEEYNATHKPTGIRAIMTGGDLKLYLICGTGFFIDAYDLFIINLVTPLWQYEYWGGLPGPRHNAKGTYPLLLRGAVNAAANIGNVIGQVLFGVLGDVFGRKFVYGKELIIAIVRLIQQMFFLVSLTRDLGWYYPSHRATKQHRARKLNSWNGRFGLG